MIAGQAQDTALDRSPDVTLVQCLAMEADKTGALLAQSPAIGAILGGADDETATSLECFGADLGVAFQAVDDVLGIWGDPAVTGKPVGSDLRSRKKSMPIALALDAGGPLALEVRRAFAGEVTDDVVAALSHRLDECGIRAQVVELARVHLDQALAVLRSTPIDRSAAAELEALACFVADRTF
jgi:geranylgeranyl diphosphate synthase type I